MEEVDLGKELPEPWQSCIQAAPSPGLACSQFMFQHKDFENTWLRLIWNMTKGSVEGAGLDKAKEHPRRPH